MRRVTVCVQSGKEWCATFLKVEEDGRTLPIGPWLLFESESGLMQLLGRGVVADADVQQLHRDLKRWGRGTVDMQLTSEQYIALLEAGYRDKRNGYEKSKARELQRASR